MRCAWSWSATPRRWPMSSSELGGDPADWLRRMKVARTDPHLRAAHAAQMAMIERAVTEGLAERLGADPESDPYPGLLAATAAAVFRASTTFWAGSGGIVPLDQLIDLAFRALAAGLPEHCACAYVKWTADRRTTTDGLRHSRARRRLPAARRGHGRQRRPAWAQPPPHPAHHRRADAGHAARRAGPDDRVDGAADDRGRPRRAARTSPGSSPPTCWPPRCPPRCGASSATSTAGRSSSRRRSSSS